MSRPTCVEPLHHVRDAPAFVRAVEVACRARGLRLTPIRARVLAVIAQAGRPLKAYDLLDRIQANQQTGAIRVGANAPPTIYRALHFLLANGFVHKLETINAYIACHHPGAAPHSPPFLICSQCHGADELEDIEIAAELRARADDMGFTASAQTLEVHGLCARCVG